MLPDVEAEVESQLRPRLTHYWLVTCRAFLCPGRSFSQVCVVPVQIGSARLLALGSLLSALGPARLDLDRPYSTGSACGERERRGLRAVMRGTAGRRVKAAW